MSDERILQIKSISGHSGPVPGRGVERQLEVCKLMDTTTCIGCKACEVACLEWNGLPFEQTTFDNTYQTMPDTRWNYWQLIRFKEVKKNGDATLSEFSDADNSDNLMWIFRKDQCMHCSDPGCLRACPADGAIVQYQNGIVDFQQENCIGCQYCVSGCPYNIPKFNETTKKVYKCTLCSDRVGQGLEPACIKSCPTGCLQFGTKEDMLHAAEERTKQLQKNGFANAGIYDPQSIDGTHVIYVLHDNTNPEIYGNLPKTPRIPLAFTVWKRFFKPILGGLSMLGLAGIFFHYVMMGPKRTQPEPAIKQEGK